MTATLRKAAARASPAEELADSGVDPQYRYPSQKILERRLVSLRIGRGVDAFVEFCE